MKKLSVIMLLSTWSVGVLAQQKPPVAPIGSVTDEYYGVSVEDPYRNLENLQDSIVLNWYKGQGDYTRKVLDAIPGRSSLIDAMKKIDQRNSSTVADLKEAGDRLFFLKRKVNEQVSRLYYEDKQGREVLLFNPEAYELGSKKTYSIRYYEPSWDGLKVIIGVAETGSEQTTIRILDRDTKQLLPEQIDRCWISIPSWLPDNSGFFYTRQQSGDVRSNDLLLSAKAMLHRLGTDPNKADQEVFSTRTHPQSGIKPEDFPIVSVSHTNPDVLLVFLWGVAPIKPIYMASMAELNRESISWKKIVDVSDEVREFFLYNKDLYVLTSKNSPNFRLLKTSIANPSLAGAEEIIPESELILERFSFAKDGLYYAGRRGVKGELYRIPMQGGRCVQKAIRLTPPIEGSYSLTNSYVEREGLYIYVTSWTKPTTLFSYNSQENRFIKDDLMETPAYPEFEDLEIKAVEVPSHDGVNVPMTLIYPKGLKQNGVNYTYLLGYGSYGTSRLQVSFSELQWCLQGGILAIAHVRGGGELGEKWRKAGFQQTKPNTWKDFIACAEYLIQNKYTVAAKLAGQGTSAGGILIGRAVTERPDLFRAAIAEVGLLNALRSEKSPNGPNNAKEFGSTATEAGFKALYEMDAYHHIRKGTKYPAMLVTTGFNDPRVSPWLSGKFAAALQVATASSKPVLYKVDYQGGHGVGNGQDYYFGRVADRYAFALWQLGHPAFRQTSRTVGE